MIELTRLIQSICTAAIGSAMPRRTATMMAIASPALIDGVQLMTFLMMP